MKTVIDPHWDSVLRKEGLSEDQIVTVSRLLYDRDMRAEKERVKYKRLREIIVSAYKKLPIEL